MKKKFLKYLCITTGIALAVALAVILYENRSLPFADNSIRLFSDGFFVAGAVLLCIALLVLVANGGGFYAFGYLGRRIRAARRRKRHPEESSYSYFDYVEERKAAGKVPVAHLFLVAGLFLVAALILALV